MKCFMPLTIFVIGSIPYLLYKVYFVYGPAKVNNPGRSRPDTADCIFCIIIHFLCNSYILSLYLSIYL